MAFCFLFLKNNISAYAAILLLCSLACANGRPQSISIPVNDAVMKITTALRSHDFDRALRLSNAALKQSPGDKRLLTLRGMTYSSLGKPDAAFADYRQVLKVSPDYLPALESAAQLEYAKDGSRAKPFLLRILKLHPEDTTAHAMLAVVDYKAKNCAGAVQNFQQAEALFTNQPDVLMEYGSCLVSLKRFSDATPVLQQVVDLSPENPVARYNLALDEWDADHADDAIQTLAPLLQSAAPPAFVLTLAADIHESKGDTQTALDLLRKAILAYPNEQEAYLDFANLSYNHGSFQVGIDMLNTGLTQLPRDADLYLYRGILYCKLGEAGKGISDFETANRLNPALPFATVAEGIAESQQHNSAEALATFRAEARRHPHNSLTQYLLAEALSRETKPEGSPEYREEIDAATLAVKLDPKLLQAHDLLATIYIAAGKPDLAIQQSRASLQVDPDDQQALYHLILATRGTGSKVEVSVLVKRLMTARNTEAQKSAKSPRLYQLVEQTPVAARQ